MASRILASKEISIMSRMTENDRLKRTEGRLRYEEKMITEAIDRLEGLKDARIISVRNSYMMMRAKIAEFIYAIHRDMKKADVG